jgi:hypothetical protein
MSSANTNNRSDGESAPQLQPPALARDELGRIEPASLADLIQWFLDHDPRVNVIRHPKVEQIFQWKQDESRRAGEEIFEFGSAEDRLALGIMQAIVEHEGEEALHGWISQLLNALDDATKTTEEVSQAFGLDTSGEASTVDEAMKIPTGAWADNLSHLLLARSTLHGGSARARLGLPATLPATFSTGQLLI